MIVGDVFGEILKDLGDVMLEAQISIPQLAWRKIAGNDDVVACEVGLCWQGTWTSNEKREPSIQSVEGCELCRVIVRRVS